MFWQVNTLDINIIHWSLPTYVVVPWRIAGSHPSQRMSSSAFTYPSPSSHDSKKLRITSTGRYVSYSNIKESAHILRWRQESFVPQQMCIGSLVIFRNFVSGGMRAFFKKCLSNVGQNETVLAHLICQLKTLFYNHALSVVRWPASVSRSIIIVYVYLS